MYVPTCSADLAQEISSDLKSPQTVPAVEGSDDQCILCTSWWCIDWSW